MEHEVLQLRGSRAWLESLSEQEAKIRQNEETRREGIRGVGEPKVGEE